MLFLETPRGMISSPRLESKSLEKYMRAEAFYRNLLIIKITTP